MLNILTKSSFMGRSRSGALALAIAIGAFLGSVSAASAHVIAHEATWGTYWYAGWHVEQATHGYPYYEYRHQHEAWANWYYPTATEFEIRDVAYQWGYSQDPQSPWFWIAYAFDETGPYVQYNTFLCVHVDGVHQTRLLNPVYQTQTGPNNKNVVWEQRVVEIHPWQTYTDCFNWSVGMFHDMAWKVHE